MSSKSRQKKHHAPQRSGATAPGDPAELAMAEPGEGDDGDESGGSSGGLLDPGEGKSKVKYYLTVGVIVFTLLTFVAPAAVQQMFTGGGGGGDDDWVSFSVPGGERITMSNSDLVYARRHFNDVVDLSGGYLAPQSVMQRQMQAGGNNRRNELDERDAIAVLAYAAAAEAEGMVLPESDYQATMQQLLGGMTAEQYVQVLRSRYITPSDFQSAVRTLLLARRYQSMLSLAAGLPDIGALEEDFREQHKEYAFDYVELEVASFVTQANELEVDDVELEEWLNAKDDIQKRPFLTDERFRAEVVSWKVGDAIPEALLAAYPLNAELAEGELAQRYYDEIGSTRFQLDEPVQVEGSMRFSQPFEEVQAECEAEAPVYFAMKDWHENLLQRQTELAQRELEESLENAEGEAPGEGAEGEEGTEGEAVAEGESGDEESTDEEVATVPEPPLEPIELASEGASLGLASHPGEELYTVEEWKTVEGVGSDGLATRMRSVPTGTIASFLVTSREGFSVVKRLEREAPYMPEYADIREEVELAWREEQQRDLAMAELDGYVSRLRELTGGDDEAEGEEGEEGEAEGEDEPVLEIWEPLEGVDEGTFAQVAAEGGREVLRMDWFDARRPAPSIDPDEPDPRQEAENYLRGRVQRALGEGAVQEPFQDTDNSHVYLVRIVGERDGDLEKMTPSDFHQLRNTLTSTAARDFSTAMSDLGELDQPDLFDMYLRSEDPEYLRELEERREAEGSN